MVMTIVNPYTAERYNLIKQFDAKQISKEEYIPKMKEVMEKEKQYIDESVAASRNKENEIKSKVEEVKKIIVTKEEVATKSQGDLKVFKKEYRQKYKELITIYREHCVVYRDLVNLKKQMRNILRSDMFKKHAEVKVDGVSSS